MTDINDMKALLSGCFSMTDLGPCSFYSGMHVAQLPDGSVQLHQSAYIHQILRRYGLLDLHPRKTPMRTEPKLQKHTGAKGDIEFIRLYQSKVGALDYAMTVSRLDIAYAVGVMSRYNANPNSSHMQAVDDIYSYLKVTPNLSPLYKAGTSKLHAFVDADHAGCLDTYRSTTGFLVLLSGSPISWASRRHKNCGTVNYRSRIHGCLEGGSRTHLDSELDW